MREGQNGEPTQRELGPKAEEEDMDEVAGGKKKVESEPNTRRLTTTTSRCSFATALSGFLEYAWFFL